MTPQKITAHLDTPIIGKLGPLDGPVAWAYAQKAMREGLPMEDITPEYCPDFPLPFAQWERGEYWGWCVSAAEYEPQHFSSTEIRRKPASAAMAAYTNAREHHNGLGPMKARNATLGTEYAPQVVWYADVTDKPLLEELLAHITHLGARHRNGFGHVTHWTIQPAEEDTWQQRPMPATTGRVMRTRAPYWHPTERTECA